MDFVRSGDVGGIVYGHARILDEFSGRGVEAGDSVVGGRSGSGDEVRYVHGRNGDDGSVVSGIVGYRDASPDEIEFRTLGERYAFVLDDVTSASASASGSLYPSPVLAGVFVSVDRGFAYVVHLRSGFYSGEFVLFRRGVVVRGKAFSGHFVDFTVERGLRRGGNGEVGKRRVLGSVRIRRVGEKETVVGCRSSVRYLSREDYVAHVRCVVRKVRFSESIR